RGFLFSREIAHEVADLVEAPEGKAKAAGREEPVAAAPGLGRLLQHQRARAVLARRERGAHRGVATANDDDVVRRHPWRSLDGDVTTTRIMLGLLGCSG